MSDNLDKVIYGLFDDEYLQKYSDIIENYQSIAKDKRYSDEYKKKAREKAKELIDDLQLNIKREAEQIIEDFKESQEFSFPDQPEAETKEDELLQETKKNTELSILRDEIKSAEEPAELVKIAQEYEEDGLLGPEVDRLVKSELKNRGEKSHIEVIENNRKIDQSVVTGAKSLLSMLTGNHFAVITPKADGGINPDFRDIEKDLKEGNTPKEGQRDLEILKSLRGGEK